MRVITLVLVIVAVFFFATKANSKTIVLEEEINNTFEKTVSILTVCKDGYQYTILDYTSITQDMKWNSFNKESQPIPCMMDFKDQSQLEK